MILTVFLDQSWIIQQEPPSGAPPIIGAADDEQRFPDIINAPEGQPPRAGERPGTPAATPGRSLLRRAPDDLDGTRARTSPAGATETPTPTSTDDPGRRRHAVPAHGERGLLHDRHRVPGPVVDRPRRTHRRSAAHGRNPRGRTPHPAPSATSWSSSTRRWREARNPSRRNSPHILTPRETDTPSSESRCPAAGFREGSFRPAIACRR